MAARVDHLITDIANERKLLINQNEQHSLTSAIVDDMIGLGPIEPLLRDDTVADILINGPNIIYVERHGKLELTTLHFRNDAHVLHLAQRIASSIGRRVDESSPMLDARLKDGSRVNVIIPPLSLKGPCISIRKFSKTAMEFANFIQLGTVSAPLARILEIAARCRLNIIISGGTGSGKTTLLNAMSRMISHGERIITIEDVAELQLQQPHVLQLETRPPNIEGAGQISQRDLVRNALRMRPDRIIVGEVRGPEAFDMMQAMNTGHNGSMSTIHANSARDALGRIENMILAANVSLPMQAIRGQMVSALDMIIQTERMRDGVRRVTEVMEVAGNEGDMISLGTISTYHYLGENADGSLLGRFESSGGRPRFLPRLDYFGLADAFSGRCSRAAEIRAIIMSIILLTLILLLVGISMLGGALVMNRTRRRELEGRVNLVANKLQLPKNRLGQADTQVIGIVGEWVRNVFLAGIQYRWGVRSTPLALLAISGFSAVISWLVIHLLLRFSEWIAVPVALASSFAIPHFVLRFEQAKAGKKFLDVFPDAVDMIVRMLRAGLPIVAIMRTVGREASAPVNSVFTTIADRIEIGMPFEEALVTASKQVGLQDFRFFAVAVTLQRTTGGNLSTTLEILCGIIRKRREVRMKARAATAEVRISAYFLGAMPFLIVSALLVVAPNYLTPLVKDPRGNAIVAIAFGMLLLAYLTMRSMMNRVARLG